MPIVKQNLIEPDVVKPGIPFKKGTLAVILLLLAALVLVLSLVTQNSNTQKQPKDKTSKTAANPADTGTAGAIDEEQRQAVAEVAKEDMAAGKRPVVVAGVGAAPAPAMAASGGAASTTGGTSTTTAAVGKTMNPAPVRPSPLPEGVHRDNQDAALYEKQFGKLGIGKPSGSTSTGYGAVTGNGRDIDVELDAQSRASKSLVTDVDGGPGATVGSLTQSQSLNSVIASLGLGGPSAAAANTPVTAPSAALQPAIDNALATLKGQAPQTTAGNRAWLNEYASDRSASKRNEVIQSYPTGSKYTLHQGKVIPATLGRQVNSDLPGEITAYTTVDVYDSMGSDALLIPKGSVLVGRYNSEIKLGQERLMFAFNRLILPDGKSFDLAGASGTDLSGASGVTGDVNNHFFKMFASSFLIAFAANKVQQPSSFTVIGGGSGPSSAAGQVLVDVGKSVLERNKSIPPTITIPQGTRINIEVTRDMEFAGPYFRRKNS